MHIRHNAIRANLLIRVGMRAKNMVKKICYFPCPSPCPFPGSHVIHAVITAAMFLCFSRIKTHFELAFFLFSSLSLLFSVAFTLHGP